MPEQRQYREEKEFIRGSFREYSADKISIWIPADELKKAVNAKGELAMNLCKTRQPKGKNTHYAYKSKPKPPAMPDYGAEMQGPLETAQEPNQTEEQGQIPF